MTFALNSARSTRLVFSTLLLLLSFGAMSSRSLAKPAPVNPATIDQEVPNPQDECKKAIVDYDKAIKIDPKNSEALTSRGICLAILGDDQGAIVDLTEALKFNTTVQYRLRAKSYMALKDYKKALTDFDAHIQQLNASATKILSTHCLGLCRTGTSIPSPWQLESCDR
jgi:tetratricopeptide (TPR) repeat protein